MRSSWSARMLGSFYEEIVNGTYEKSQNLSMTEMFAYVST